MTTALTFRDELATAIRAANTDDVNVYPYPVELPALPAVVLVPADPYWQPSHFTTSGVTSAVDVHLDLQILVTRTELETVFPQLETIAVACGVAIDTLPVCRWVDLSSPEPVEVNDIPAVIARVGVVGRV